MLFGGVRPTGTQAHAFISSHVDLKDLAPATRLVDGVDIVELALKYRAELGFVESSIGELAAYVAYAHAFPDNFLALVDTYDTLSSGEARAGGVASRALLARLPLRTGGLTSSCPPPSHLRRCCRAGVPNFICVALALRDTGHKALGIRLDSGDLAYLSKETRRM